MPADRNGGATDPVTWLSTIIILTIIAAVTVIVRRHPAIPAATAVIGLAATAIMWRTLDGPWHTWATRLAVTTQAATIAGTWNAHGWWHLTLPALAVFTALVITPDNLERRRNKFANGLNRLNTARTPTQTNAALRRVQAGAAEIADIIHAYAEHAKVGKAAERNNCIHVNIDSPIPLNPKLPWFVANRLGFKASEVILYDLSDIGQAGKYDLVFDTRPPAFSRPLRPVPPLEQWPAGKIPIGEYGDGNTAWIGQHHVLIGGTTGKGKTNTLEVIIWGKAQLGYSVWLIDPKRVMSGKYLHTVGVSRAVEPAHMAHTLAALAREMDRRYTDMDTRRIEHWDGHRILVVVDETADLLTTNPDAAIDLVRLMQKSRAAGIEIVVATQRPDRASIPPLVKANADTVIALGVANPTAERILLGEQATRAGWNLSDRNIKAGYGVLVTPGRDDARVRIYPTPGTRGLPTTPTPINPVNPPPSNPPHPGPTQVEPLESTPQNQADQPELDGPDPDAGLDAIAIALDDRQPTPDRILAMLGDHPVSGKTLALTLQISGQAVSQHLARLVTQGAARKVKGGWIRAR